MKKILMIMLICCVSCTDDSAAKSTLDKSGYTNIEITGYDFTGCSDDDFTHTGFRAKNSNGKVVEGVVCCGLIFKGCTVRF